MSGIQVVPMQLDDGTIFYVEAQEGTLPVPTSAPVEELGEEERTRDGRKGIFDGAKGIAAKVPTPAQSMQIMQKTIRAYAGYSLAAFKNFGAANVDEVTLEFGINFSADAGVPYVANGKAQSSLKITVKCSYNNPANEQPNGQVNAALPTVPAMPMGAGLSVNGVTPSNGTPITP
jgi:hypothetical protein